MTGGGLGDSGWIISGCMDGVGEGMHGCMENKKGGERRKREKNG